MGEPLSRQQRVAGLIRGVVCALALIPSVARPAELLEVKAVRFWALGETTRIAIEVSGEFQFKHDRLFEPDRIYFDILGAKPGFTRQKVHTIPVGDKLLKQIRVSETQRGVTRIVLDLEQAADFSAAQLTNPDRLVVELRRRGRPAEETSSPVPPPPAQAPKQQAVTAPAEAPAASAPIAEARQEPARPRDEPIPVPAKKSAIGNRSLVRALGLKLQRVVIDPGHGGSDTGTIGPTGLMEKDLVLDVALR
ncbi:MAG TPA: N-acetylmuramoyl-L-alanine amidase, partial [Bryobacteraceae bacterium]|nr:N-acetylmuramoyl-L-alanine amidase [Bryobacteraceae bacterium]